MKTFSSGPGVGDSARTIMAIAVMAIPLAFVGCGDDDGGAGEGTTGEESETGEETETGEEDLTYGFASDLVEDANSASWSGQAARQVLIEELKVWIGGKAVGPDAEGITKFVSEESLQADVPGDVYDTLMYYVEFDGDANGDDAIAIATKTLDPLQGSVNEISTGKKLINKLAGNDSATDHKDWASEFVGWADEDIAAHGGDVSSPEGLLKAFLWTIDANAMALAIGETTLPVHLTAKGQDLQQLVQKFLVMAVNFSQGTDDYLDLDPVDDGKGVGVAVSNVDPDDEGKPYTSLEHHWDEGFGYFGAAADYASYNAREAAGNVTEEGDGSLDWNGSHDTNGDGYIDLAKEFNFGASVNAAKRDLGSVGFTNPTDFKGMILGAFHAGRSIIHNADGDLNVDEREALLEQSDRVRWGWEACIAATAVHYINDIGADIQSWMDATEESPGASMATLAKHWSELKGFSLGFQFSPVSPLSDEDFATFHALIGDSPVLEADGMEAWMVYKADLDAAASLLAAAWDFDEDAVAGW